MNKGQTAKMDREVGGSNPLAGPIASMVYGAYIAVFTKSFPVINA